MKRSNIGDISKKVFTEEKSDGSQPLLILAAMETRTTATEYA